MRCEERKTRGEDDDSIRAQLSIKEIPIDEGRKVHDCERNREDMHFVSDFNHKFSRKIKVDVGGYKYTTSLTTLTCDPNSMLAAMFSGKFSLATDDEGCFFIDRNGEVFDYVLDWLRSGETELIEPEDSRLRLILLSEAKYYRLSNLVEHLTRVPITPDPPEEEKSPRSSPQMKSRDPPSSSHHHRMPLERISQHNYDILISQLSINHTRHYGAKSVICCGRDMRKLQLCGQIGPGKFYGCSFAGMDLRGFKFINADLSYCDFSKACLENAIVIKCVLTGANFSGCNLKNVGELNGSFTIDEQTLMEGAKFGQMSNVDMRHKNLRGCQFHNVSKLRLTGSDLTGCTFEDMQNMDLSNMELPRVTINKPSSVSFDGADLTGALISAGVFNCSFVGANLKEVTFKSYLDENRVVHRSLSQVSFGSANLTNARFEDLDLNQVVFEQAFNHSDLTGAHFSQCWINTSLKDRRFEQFRNSLFVACRYGPYTQNGFNRPSVEYENEHFRMIQ